jgi:hypothetical protein
VQVEKWDLLMKKRGDAPAQQQSSTPAPAPAPAAKAEPDWTSSDALPF